LERSGPSAIFTRELSQSDLDSSEDVADGIANTDISAGDQGGRRPRSGLGNRLAATKNKIGSALQTARLRGKDNSDVSEPLFEEQPSGTGDPRDLSAFREELVANDILGDNDEVPRDTDGLEEEADSGTSKRLIQFGRRQQGSGRGGFSSRIGSAIQNARQKGNDTSERQQQRSLAGLRDKFMRNRQSDDASQGGALEQNQSAETSVDDHVAHDGNFEWTCKVWTCKVCTFINNSENLPIHQTSCTICDSERPVEENSNVNSEVLLVEENSNNVNNEMLLDPTQTTDPASQDMTEGECLKASDTLDAAPPGASRRGRFGGLGVVVSSKGLETQNRNRMGGRFSFMKRPQSGDEDTLFDGGAVTLKNVHAGTQMPAYEGGDSGTVPMKMFKNRWIVAVEHSGHEASHDPEVNDKVEKCFFVRAYKANQDSSDKGIERYCSIGDLLHLHAQISSGIEFVLPQLTNDRSDQSMGRTILQVETVVVVGRILDGLLDVDDDDMVEKTQSYIGKSELWRKSPSHDMIC
jgi:hypothetical protein